MPQQNAKVSIIDYSSSTVSKQHKHAIMPKMAHNPVPKKKKEI